MWLVRSLHSETLRLYEHHDANRTDHAIDAKCRATALISEVRWLVSPGFDRHRATDARYRDRRSCRGSLVCGTPFWSNINVNLPGLCRYPGFAQCVTCRGDRLYHASSD